MSRDILIITTPFRPNIGGVETHLDDLVLEGAKSGYKFVVLTYQPLITRARGKPYEKGKGYVIYRIPWIRLNLFLKLVDYPILEFIYLFPPLLFAGIILLLFKNSQISVIHAQGLVAGTVGVILGKVFGKKIIISTHSIYSFPAQGLYRGFTKWLFKSADIVLALSSQSRDEILSLGVGERNVQIFTYWVNQSIFTVRSKHKSRNRLNLLGSFICLFVGRLVEVKGVNELLEATKNIDNKISFVIAGDGPLAEKIKLVSERQKNIIFVGRVENDRLSDYYNASDVLIVPSTHEEGFGRVILEALSCGVPVIGSNRGAIPEAISKEVGILIDVTPQNIKQALELLVRNKRKLNKLSKAARVFALKRYSSNNLEMITRHYE